MSQEMSVNRTWQLAGIPGPIVRLQVCVLCATTGMGTVYSVLALDAKSLGGTAFLAGVLLAAFGGMRFVANVPTGIASERWGRRGAAIAGLVAAALASILAAFAHDFPSLLVCVLLQGLAMGVFNTASLSAIADLGTPESRVRDMAAYQGTFLFGLSIGPAIGGFVAAKWGFGAAFALQALLAIFAALIFLGAAEAPRKKSGPFSASLLYTLLGPAVMTYSVILTRAVSVWVLLPLIAQSRFSMGVGTIGLMLTIGSVANLAVLPIAPPLAKRVGRSPIMVGSAMIVIVALAILLTMSSMEGLWIASFLFGAGSGLALPVSVACAADAAPRGQTGTAMGIMRSVTDLGMLTGPILVGVAIDRLPFSQSGGIAICMLILVISTTLFVIMTLPQMTTSTSKP